MMGKSHDPISSLPIACKLTPAVSTEQLSACCATHTLMSFDSVRAAESIYNRCAHRAQTESHLNCCACACHSDQQVDQRSPVELSSNW